MGVGVATNEISGPSGQDDLVTFVTGTYVAVYCRFCLRDSGVQNLPVSVDRGIGLFFSPSKCRRMDAPSSTYYKAPILAWMLKLECHRFFRIFVLVLHVCYHIPH